MSVSVTNTSLGQPKPGDKYYNASYGDWYAIKSVMTITNPVITMYDSANIIKYFFRCHPTATVNAYGGIRKWMTPATTADWFWIMILHCNIKAFTSTKTQTLSTDRLQKFQ